MSAQAASTVSSEPLGPNASPCAKLDGVLYHIYAKTSSIVTHLRFTHVGEGQSGQQQQQQQQQQQHAESSSTPKRQTSRRKPGKWFALEVEDSDVFREEIKLWRSVSSFINAEGESGTASQNGVPAMVLDVILDPTALAPEQFLVIEESGGDGFDHSLRPPRRRKVRTHASSSGPKQEYQAESSDETPRAPAPIVLETWRVDFEPTVSDELPDLPQLYKNATAHFKEMLSLVKTLPAFRLRQRLCSEASEPKPLEHPDALKIGARLAVEESTAPEDCLIGLYESLVSSRRGSFSNNTLVSHSFTPLITPIGTLITSVEYRSNAEFYVEDTRMVEGLQEAALDDDYFSSGRAQPIAHLRSLADNTDAEQRKEASGSERKKSIVSSLSQQRHQFSPSPGASTSAKPAEGTSHSRRGSEGVAARLLTSDAIAPGIATTSNAPPAKPVAGLSSLRSNPTVPTYATIGTAVPPNVSYATTGPSASSSMSPVPGSEAAFLTHGRKTSTSERKIRTVGSSSSTSGSATEIKDHPQSPVATSPLASRPVLSRAAVSSSTRTGSYSPSSPSPLAQQLFAQQSALAAPGTGRLSSSPSFRQTIGAAGAASVSPSLRSVFQAGTPSVSQTSLSSLSKTPPRYLTDFKQAGGAGQVSSASSSLSGVRGGSRQNESAGVTQTQQSPVPGSNFSISVPRQPSVAPQMIKRYSSNFSYRFGQRGGSAETEANDGGSYNAPYSKSWQARIEQRQMIAAKSLGRDESHSIRPMGSMESFSQRQSRRPSLAASQSQDEDLHDLVRMIESKTSIGNQDQRQVSGSSSIDDASASNEHTQSAANTSKEQERSSDPSVPYTPESGSCRAYANVASSAHTSYPAGATIFSRGQPISRTRIDDMLAKMQQSVRYFGTSISSVGSRGSPASGGAATVSSGGSSQPDYPTAPHSSSPLATKSPLSQATVVTADRGIQRSNSPPSRDYRRRELGPLRRVTPPSGEDSKVDIEHEKDSFVTPTRHRSHRSTQAQTQGLETDADEMEEGDRDHAGSHQEERLSRSHPGRDTSRSSLELYGPMGSHPYDPLEDETAGRLELAAEDVVSDGGGYVVGRAGAARMGSAQPSSGRTEAHIARRSRQNRAPLARPYGDLVSHTSPTGNISPAQDDADNERQQRKLIRQFGHAVGSSSARGHATSVSRPLQHTHSIHAQAQAQARASMSPWRQRGFHPSASMAAGSPGQGTVSGPSSEKGSTNGNLLSLAPASSSAGPTASGIGAARVSRAGSDRTSGSTSLPNED